MQLVLRGLFALSLLFVNVPARAAQLPGMAQLSGKVTVPKPVGQLSVYAYNLDKRIGYLVYVVNGVYRVSNMFPGHYEITLRGTVGQKSWGVAPQTIKTELAATSTGAVDFTLKDTNVRPVYAGGLTYEGWSDVPFDEPKPVAVPTPYNVIYPPGKPRELIEGICMGCHTASFLPYGVPRTFPDGRPVHDKDGWAITVDRMLAKKTYMDGRPLTLTKQERAELIDYLNNNFGADSVPRAVLQEKDPPLDTAALEKAQLIEYRFPNSKKFPTRSNHHVTFNPDGTVWTLDRGSNGPGRGPIWLDPSTGEHEFYPDNGEGEPIIAEWISADIDGSVWFAGLRHFDRKTGNLDIYKSQGPATSPIPNATMPAATTSSSSPIGILTGIFDSHGDLWLTSGGITKWDRQTDTFKRWELPAYRAGSYGISLDSKDRVWIAEAGTDGIGRFDPTTEKYVHCKLVTDDPLAFQFRRVGVDQQDRGWAAAWSSRGMQNSRLYSCNAETLEIKSWKMPIEYANPYDAAVDDSNNVWVATDNHVVKFDQKTEKFTNYPVTTRTDIARLTIGKDGSIWFAPRNAGQSGGYGSAISVLYPDKDKITSLKAYTSPRSYFSRQLNCKNCKPVTPEGKVKLVDIKLMNPGAYDEVLKKMGLPTRANPRVGVKTGVEGIQ